MIRLLTRIRPRPVQPTLVLRPNPLGLGQELTHIVPDTGVQHIGADRFIPAEALAAEAIGVGTRAAVVRAGKTSTSEFQFRARKAPVCNTGR